ncbi:MAG: response regulator [Cyanobacteria bacterium J06621_8]
MNSQDKPIEGNDNLDLSLETSDSIEQRDENSGDLWSEENEDSEIVTEFISAETAAQNDAKALADIAPKEQKEKNSGDLWSEENEDSEIVTEIISAEVAAQNDVEALADSNALESSSDNGLDLESWDFRNPVPDGRESNELDDFRAFESSDSESPASEFSPDEIDDPILKSSKDFASEEIELDELVVAESAESEVSLEDIDEPILEASEDIASEEIALDELVVGESAESELNLEDIDEPILEPSGDLSLESLELDELVVGEPAESELNLEGIDEPILEQSGDLASEEIELDELLVGESTESELNLEGIDELILEPSGDLSLESLELDELENNNLEDLLNLDSESNSLDSLITEPTASLDESQLITSLDSADLDSLLDEEPQAEVSTPLKVSPPKPATPQRLTPPAPSPVKAQAFDQTMRVSVRKLDNLNNLIGELVVKRNRLEDDQERLRRFLDNLLGHVQTLGEAGAKMHDMYERSLLEGALMASRQSRNNAAVAAGVAGSVNEQPQEEGLDALEMDRFTGFHLLSQEIIELIVRVREAASDIQFVVDETDKVAQTFRQVTSQLQEGMNSSRMVAFGQTADRLPRAIRDISRKQKKQTKLHVEGKDVLIDKMIVEHLYNPMTHLVNNAISHGIEKPESRLEKDKPEVGNIYIRAFIQGNQTVITVRDDGAGIDPEIVKKKAIDKNLITWATAQNLSNQEVYELLFHPGFSTKEQADDFAGRGVGMDVVNTDLKKIRGSISTESEVGKGTTFTIRLPLVLSICKALTCVSDNSQIAFPIDGVEDTKEYLPSDLQTNVNGVRCISWNNTLLPLRPLKDLLNYNRQIRRTGIYNASHNNDDTISVIILRSLDNLLAIEVDEIKTEQEIVIKQIDGPIAKPPGIAGATVLGDGTIMPIGDVLELIEIAQGKRTIEIGFNILGDEGKRKQAQAESVQQEPMVLVVDDSITVRELLSMSFNKLGYRVEQARDGQEAWDKLRGGLVCDMIFSDIEMPRMNGLELLSHLHQDPKLKSIPVAMLTSRGADKHRQLASDLGSKAYLTKPYTEKDLMDVAQHLIEINRANKEAESATVNIKRVQSNTEFQDAPLVLIIDDSVTVRELLSMSFKKAGYRVEQARDGQEAWEKLSDGLECDLAFCDIEMPRMNGLELLSQLQKDEKLSALPIAMLTSRGAQKMRNIAASRGANGYFVKPYVEEDLLKAAAKMIKGENLIETSE